MTRPSFIRLGLFTLVVGGAIASADQMALSTPGDVAWQWYDGCSPQQQVRVRVSLEGKAVFSGTFPACQMRRGDIRDESPQKVLEFTFRPKATIFGAEFDSLGSPQVEGNIWRAGGDADALLLGVSFSTPERILLNSVHVARAQESSRLALARGLTIETSFAQVTAQPATRKK
jgi:hypothetical protein